MKPTVFFKNLLHYTYRKYLLWAAINTANQRHLAENKQMFVIPSSNGKLQVLSTAEIKRLRTIPYKRTRKLVNGQYRVTRHYFLPKSFTRLQLMKEAFYYTPTHINAPDYESLTPEQKKEKQLQYLRWCDTVRY